jgi:hypothetical protein
MGCDEGYVEPNQLVDPAEDKRIAQVFYAVITAASWAASRGVRSPSATGGSAWPAGCQAKYNRSAMENARQLQCKALRGRGKSRRRGDNGKQ